jgi:hypothetical protein
MLEQFNVSDIPTTIHLVSLKHFLAAQIVTGVVQHCELKNNFTQKADTKRVFRKTCNIFKHAPLWNGKSEK